MVLRVLGFLSLLAACSCEQLPFVGHAEATPLLTGTPARTAGEGGDPSARERIESTQQLAARIIELRASLAGDVALPAHKAPPRCPTMAAGTDAERTAVVRVHDARYEPKDLLSLEFRTRLESDELATLGGFYLGGAASLWNLESAQLRTPRESTRVGDLLDELGQRRYLVVLHVTSYAKPHVFRRKDVIRPEWNAGALGGRIIVYERRGSVPLCEAWLTVRGDARDAPLRRALRDVTRARLHRELLDKTWTMLGQKLEALSPDLRMPPPGARGSADDRW